MTYLLGIDTSCDETSGAIVQDSTVISNVISSQIALHQPYGGVFPTVAKLAHQEKIAPVVTATLKRAQLTPAQLDGVAVTVGPGLAPALEVGLKFAKDFALQNHLPLLAVNHLEGHLLSPFLQPCPRSSAHSHRSPPASHFPSLGLVVSGGHTQFVKINDFGSYQLLGETLDDAAGECLDKIGRLLNLGYPAAPVIEQLAKTGDPTVYRFPLPLTTHHDYNLSFSGLKTYARNLITKLETDSPLTPVTISNLACATQEGVFRHLVYKLDKLLRYYQNSPEQTPFIQILVGGGVAQNARFRTLVRKVAANYHLPIFFPYHQKICGDNAAMIAFAALSHFRQKDFATTPTAINAIERQPNLSI